jgi:glycosyltransferase involved in cell wall biosynthesis
MSQRVLYVCHNHPNVRHGGAETYALELYEAMRVRDVYDTILLARSGPPMSAGPPPPGGAVVAAVQGDSHQFLLFTDGSRYDRLFGAERGGSSVGTVFKQFLLDVRPDVVHFHHTLFLGYDLVTVTRTTLPGVAILYTLHDYMPICHRWGQLLRADGAQCSGAAPDSCHQCFPDIRPVEFASRDRVVRSHLDGVDLFIAPSAFLRDRYVEWGIPEERIVREEYGRRPSVTSEPRDAYVERRNRFGYFGQLTHAKGVNVLLEAVGLLRARGIDASLSIYGSGLDIAPAGFRNRFRELVALAEGTAVFAGEYEHADVMHSMQRVDWVVVPSIWPENSPLVIQEAFATRRPVICSGVGAMAEKVTADVDGLHFPPGDARALAQTLERAVSQPQLWERLRGAVRPPHAMAEHLEFLEREYERLLAGSRGIAA